MSSTTKDAPIWGIPDGEIRSSIQTLIPQSERIPWGVKDVDGVNVMPFDPNEPVIVIGILDTGVDSNHPDLEGVILSAEDFTGSRSGPRDVNGHGTHCAGIAAATDANNAGIRGVNPRVKIRSYKVLDDGGSGTDRTIEAGYRKAMADGCNVISMSLGGEGPMPGMENLIGLAWVKNIVTVAASGNGGNNRRRAIYPAAYRDCVAVGSYDSNGKLSSFSQGDPQIDCFAPGGGVESTYPGGRYTVMSGTSMSTPHVAAVAAEIMRRMHASGVPITALRVVEMLRSWCVKDNNYPGETFGGSGKPRIPAMAPVPVPPPPPAPVPNPDAVEVEITRKFFNWVAAIFADPTVDNYIISLNTK